jgi:tocopherol O-methyltransferase
MTRQEVKPMAYENSFSGVADAVRDFYDRLDDIYEETAGDHIHHGYWEPGAPHVDREDAEDLLVRRLVEFTGVQSGARVLDAGCGVGGTAILLAAELGCAVEGITLSGKQADRARAKAEGAGVGDLVTFGVVDAMATGFPDDSFDVVLAVESLEVMPDKGQFLAECRRVLRPGGWFAAATWCRRQGTLDAQESGLLEAICADFVLPFVLSLEEYVELCGANGFGDVRFEDWSARVAPTWQAAPRPVTDLGSGQRISRLLRGRAQELVRLADSARRMRNAYETDVIRYGVFRGNKEK